MSTIEPVFDAVCVGAHPDDVEIGMGATVAKMTAAGLRVAIVDLTDGEPTPHGTRELRAAEAMAAAGALGVKRRITLSQKNRYLFDTVEARSELAEALRELRPRLLFAPYPQDAHPDHIAAAQICLGARFYSKFHKTEMRGEPYYPARLMHYMAVHLRLVVPPTFVVSCGEHLATKLHALSLYRSQFTENQANRGIVQMMEDSAHHWGRIAGVEAAEPFFSTEPVAIDSPHLVL